MNGMRASFWAANHTSTGMSRTPLGHGPRRVFDRQRWGAILTLDLRGSWSQAGDGLVGLVADVQPPTGPADLGWGLQRAALLGQKCGREDALGSSSSAPPLPTSGPIWTWKTIRSSLRLSGGLRDEGWDAPSLPHPPHCQSQALWKSPRGSPGAGGRRGSRHGPAPAAKNKALAVQKVRGSAERQKGSGAPSPSLDLTSSSHSLCCFFLAMSRAVSPASFTVRDKVRGHGQGQRGIIT